MYIGIDIGGTKCAVVLADASGGIIEKRSFATGGRKDAGETLKRILSEAETLAAGRRHIRAAGVSCGGPLDAQKGVILSPPNLPGWDNVPITALLEERLGVPAFLQNDADACALAEWRYGAGRGYANIVFLTFGTGMGAGIIANGRLYSGGSGMAGEIGHIRIKQGEGEAGGGHTGYGKAGSFEGYCSGGGIAQYGYGSAAEVAGKAKAGDEKAIGIFRQVGRDLGAGISVLLDILNPDAVIIGSIYTRANELLDEQMYEVIEKEALAQNRKHCKILKSALGEQLGDIAAVSVAVNGISGNRKTPTVEGLLFRYPELDAQAGNIREAIGLICECYRSGGKLLLCGNGGSAADCEHIAGELLKGFIKKRPVTAKTDQTDKTGEAVPNEIRTFLQGSLPAVSLTSHPAFSTAYINDVNAEFIFAQQLYGLAKPGDILLALSTSGNAANVLNAAKLAKCLDVKVIAFTGRGGGELSKYADVALRAPADETYLVQEYHLPIYHAVCAEIERELFV